MAKPSPEKRKRASVVAPAVLKADLKADQYQSRALEKGLQALEELSQAPDGLSLIEVAARLQLTKPSAFRIVRTLESLSYATKNSTGRYCLSGAVNRQLPVRSVQMLLRHGEEPLRALMHEFRETASMAALYENHIEVVMVVESPQLVRMTNTLGRILPPHGSSLGKAITATLSREKREHLLRTYGTAPITQHTLTDERVIEQQLDQVRSSGHAEDWEESTPGGVCFASPIIGTGDAAVGAISISLPRMRLEGAAHERQLIEAVSRTAAGISQKLSGNRQ